MDTELAKLPPQATDLEKGVLGAVLLDGKTMAEVADVITGPVFYLTAHALIWKAMADMYAVRAPIDIRLLRSGFPARAICKPLAVRSTSANSPTR
jgi:replicative DNA helicase